MFRCQGYNMKNLQLIWTRIKKLFKNKHKIWHILDHWQNYILFKMLKLSRFSSEYKEHWTIIWHVWNLPSKGIQCIKNMPYHHSIPRELIKHPEKHHQSTKTTCVQTPYPGNSCRMTLEVCYLHLHVHLDVLLLLFLFEQNLTTSDS